MKSIKYVVKHSSIACVVQVNDISIVHFHSGKPPGNREPDDKIWNVLPAVVQNAIVQRFKAVFEKVKEECMIEDVKAFDDWLKALPTLEFEVPEQDVPPLARDLSSPRLNPWYQEHPTQIVLPLPIQIYLP